jgi:hypothetical protein
MKDNVMYKRLFSTCTFDIENILRVSISILSCFIFLNTTSVRVYALPKKKILSYSEILKLNGDLLELNKYVKTITLSQALPKNPSERKVDFQVNDNNNLSPDLNFDDALIPEASAIIVAFPSEISLDPKRKVDFPITLILINPIYDSDGNIAIPEKSLVNARIKVTKAGDSIVVTGFIIGGRLIPINSNEILVPSQKKNEDYTYQYQPSPSRLNNVLTNLSSYQLSSAFLSETNTNFQSYVGAGLALASGLTAPRPKAIPGRVVIPQGTIYISSLTTSLKVSKTLIKIDVKNSKSIQKYKNDNFQNDDKSWLY